MLLEEGALEEEGAFIAPTLRRTAFACEAPAFWQGRDCARDRFIYLINFHSSLFNRIDLIALNIALILG